MSELRKKICPISNLVNLFPSTFTSFSLDSGRIARETYDRTLKSFLTDHGVCDSAKSAFRCEPTVCISNIGIGTGTEADGEKHVRLLCFTY